MKLFVHRLFGAALGATLATALLALASAPAHAAFFAKPRNGQTWEISGTVLAICTCNTVRAGYRVLDPLTVGLNYYHGGFFLSNETTQYQGLFAKVQFFGGSLFLNTRLGKMKTRNNPVFYNTETGAYAGFDIGNQWHIADNVFVAMNWYGQSAYLQKTAANRIYHLIRFETGVTF